jgi:hypothetical protein
MEIIINKCYGGYGLSNKAIELYLQKLGIPVVVNPDYENSYYKKYIVGDDHHFDAWNIKHRNDPILIQVVKELIEEANGSSADLEIVEIPDGCEYYIGEYDGMEHIADTWFEVTTEELVKGMSLERVRQLLEVDSIKIKK